MRNDARKLYKMHILNVSKQCQYKDVFIKLLTFEVVPCGAEDGLVEGLAVGGTTIERAEVAPTLVALAAAVAVAPRDSDTDWRVRVKLPEETAEVSCLVSEFTRLWAAEVELEELDDKNSGNSCKGTVTSVLADTAEEDDESNRLVVSNHVEK